MEVEILNAFNNGSKHRTAQAQTFETIRSNAERSASYYKTLVISYMTANQQMHKGIRRLVSKIKRLEAQIAQGGD